MTIANRIGVIAAGLLTLLVPLAPTLADSPEHASTNDAPKTPASNHDKQTVPSSGPTTSPAGKPLQVDPMLASLNKHLAKAASLTDAQQLKLDEMTKALRAKYGPEIPRSKAGDLLHDYSRNLTTLLTPQQLATLAPGAAREMEAARETANRVLCASHLRLIEVGVLLHSNDHRTAYPPDLGTLFTSWKDIDPHMFLCPDRHTTIPADFKQWTLEKQAAWINANSDYVYRGAGVKSPPGPGTVVAFDKPENHVRPTAANDNNGGGNVLFGNGQVRFLSASDFAPATQPASPDDATPPAP